MIYGHYDVQPPDPLELWDSPPFEPVLKNGYVFARGSTDNKGQILAHILGIQETIEEHRELPVNLHLVIEGEEEIGSANLGPFLKQNRETLKCDVAVVSDTGMIARGVPTMSYGLRGVTALEVKVTGPKMDLHSGVFGGAVANPITALAQLLATLHDRDGRVAIAGFYDRVKPLEDWEREAWRKLPVDGDKLIREETGVPELFGEAGYNSVERIWARPTAEINGIGGGLSGARDKNSDRQPRICETDVPSRSRAKRRGDSGTRENAFAKESAQRRHDGSYHRPQRSVVSNRSALRDGRSGATRIAQSFQPRRCAHPRRGQHPDCVGIPGNSRHRNIAHGTRAARLPRTLPKRKFSSRKFRRRHSPEQSNPSRARALVAQTSCLCGRRASCLPLDGLAVASLPIFPRIVACAVLMASGRTIGLESPLRTADTTASSYEMASDSGDLVRSC